MTISVKTHVVTLAATAAFLAITASAGVASAKSAKLVRRYGVNACKGQSDCKSGNHDCKGQNNCKGQGFKVESSKQCKADGGSLTEKN